MLPLGKLLGVFGAEFLSPPNIFLEFAFAVDTIFETFLSSYIKQKTLILI
ncbi:hypothetical protein [Clostridium butanoliproducens]|nr:hypothetical protein [Clostridium butanoliproducens]